MEKKDLKIVFFGTPDFAVESLKRLVEGGYNVVGVVTMPDKPAGRGHHLLQSDVKKYAVENGLHLMQPVKLKDEEFVKIAIPKEQRSSRPEAALLMWLLTRQSFGAEARLQAGFL